MQIFVCFLTMRRTRTLATVAALGARAVPYIQLKSFGTVPTFVSMVVLVKLVEIRKAQAARPSAWVRQYVRHVPVVLELIAFLAKPPRLCSEPRGRPPGAPLTAMRLLGPLRRSQLLARDLRSSAWTLFWRV